MTLSSVRDLARRRPEQEFFLNRLYGVHLSPFLTVVCLRLGLSPDQVTIIGGAFGAAGVGLLLLPLGIWSVLAVVALQLGYLFDFSDGQVARLTNTTSMAGGYLDWLTHFYIPVGAVLALAASVAWSTGAYVLLALGILAALELASFAFSCREHILVAIARQDPSLSATAPFHAALADDTRPSDVLTAPDGPAKPLDTGGIRGRRHRPTWRSIVGELLIYPGAVHLLSLAVLADVLIESTSLAASSPIPPFRALVLAAWAALLFVHAPMAIRRGHAVIAAVELRAAASNETEPTGPAGQR